jgi:hypothetical protein
MLLDPETGERRAHLDTYSPVLDLTAADLDDDGDVEVVAAAAGSFWRSTTEESARAGS